MKIFKFGWFFFLTKAPLKKKKNSLSQDISQWVSGVLDGQDTLNNVLPSVCELI